jgi:hypothetical protein
MMIIGVDYHPSFQTIAFLVEETGECGEQETHAGSSDATTKTQDRSAETEVCWVALYL